MAPSGKHQDLSSLHQAAEYAGVSTKTIRRMIARGEITGYRVGQRLIRVDLAELDRALSPIPTVARHHGVA